MNVDRPTQRIKAALTVPNISSAFRLVSVPALFFLAWIDEPGFFLVLLGLSFFSDGVDGLLARKLHQTSEFGARLDSIGDLATYASVPICACRLWPEIMLREAHFVVAVIASYMVAAVFGLLKYGRLPCYHTWGAKLSAILMGSSALLLFSDLTAWPFRLFTPFFVLTQIEGIAITAVLPKWKADIRSVRQALKTRDEMNEKNCAVALPEG